MMNRNEFLKNCGFACLGGGLLAGILQSCSPSKMITANIIGSDLIIPLNHFVSDSNVDKKYIVARNDKLQFPVCVYKKDANAYIALWMRCPHKGVELQVFGQKLVCPAHGSEFEHTGKVLNGPAETDLRILPVQLEHKQLRISLK